MQLIHKKTDIDTIDLYTLQMNFNLCSDFFFILNLFLNWHQHTFIKSVTLSKCDWHSHRKIGLQLVEYCDVAKKLEIIALTFSSLYEVSAN